MQIILLHSGLTRARSVTLSGRHLMVCAIALSCLIVFCAAALYYATLRYAAVARLPMFETVLASLAVDTESKKDRYYKENLAIMAVKIGEMQAQLMRLDALGERVQGLAGVKPEEFNFKELPGRGGPSRLLMPDQPIDLGLDEFGQSLSMLEKYIAQRDDYMNVVETALMRDRLRSKMLPTIQPVNVSYNASGFGARLDPFSGRRAFHDGIDFAAPTGTPIVAAAGGVVIAAEYHYQFGNMLEIDHGNDIVTRYAHASKLLVRLGDIVKRGQHIADIGSTGRSTGPHLHFEVLVKGVAQNPQKFLTADDDRSKKSQISRK